MASQLVAGWLVLHDYHKVMGLSMHWWLDVASFVCQLMQQPPSVVLPADENDYTCDKGPKVVLGSSC
jgi:hypothetical protein